MNYYLHILYVNPTPRNGTPSRLFPFNASSHTHTTHPCPPQARKSKTTSTLTSHKNMLTQNVKKNRAFFSGSHYSCLSPGLVLPIDRPSLIPIQLHLAITTPFRCVAAVEIHHKITVFVDIVRLLAAGARVRVKDLLRDDGELG